MKKIYLPFTLLGLGLLIAFFSGAFQAEKVTGAKSARPNPTVVPYWVRTQELYSMVEALGTTKAKASVALTSKVADVVTHVAIKDGQKVKQGDLLLRLNDSQQRARLASAQIKLEEHQREQNRISTLVSKHAVAELEQDRLQSLIETAQAELRLAQAQLQERTILAPFSGQLGLNQLSVGTLLSPNDVITTLQDTSVLKVDFTVAERFYTKIKVGDTILAKNSAYQGEQFSGVVTGIDNQIDPISRSLTVRAEIDNQDGRLLPGMLLSITLIYERNQGLAIPESALFSVADEHYVWLIDEQNRVHRQVIELGMRRNGLVQVLAGLNDNQQIVHRGLERVKHGQSVNVQPSEPFTHKEAN